MGRNKNMFMDLQCLIQHIENLEELKAYNERRARKSKAFSISKSLNNKSNKDGGYSRHDDGRNIG